MYSAECQPRMQFCGVVSEALPRTLTSPGFDKTTEMAKAMVRSSGRRVAAAERCRGAIAHPHLDEIQTCK